MRHPESSIMSPVGHGRKGKGATIPNAGNGLEFLGFLKDIKPQLCFCRYSYVFLGKISFPGLDVPRTTLLCPFRRKDRPHWGVLDCVHCCCHPSLTPALPTSRDRGPCQPTSFESASQGWILEAKLLWCDFWSLCICLNCQATGFPETGSCHLLPDSDSASRTDWQSTPCVSF